MLKLSRILTFFDAVNEWMGRITSFSIFVMMIAVVYEIIMRYLFGSPTEWAFELTNIMLLFAASLAASYTLAHREHVIVDILYSRFSALNKSLIDLLTAPFFFIFIIIFLFKGTEMALESLTLREQSESVWGPPIYPVKISMVVGVFLVFIQGIVKIIRDFHSFKNGRVFREAGKGDQE